MLLSLGLANSPAGSKIIQSLHVKSTAREEPHQEWLPKT